MSSTYSRLLVWMPRVLGALFAAFVGLLSADVFDEELTAWQTLIAFAVHLVPAVIVVLVLVVAWRWEAVGGLLFLGAGVGYAIAVIARNHPLSWIPAISGPLFLIGILFLLSGRVLPRTRGA